MNQIEIYTDGACKGNPGPGGWGVLLRSGTTQKELFGGEPSTTNNRMEPWRRSSARAPSRSTWTASTC
jgi:ribonuclease HI